MKTKIVMRKKYNMVNFSGFLNAKFRSSLNTAFFILCIFEYVDDERQNKTHLSTLVN